MKEKQPITFSFHYQDAIKVNKSLGYDDRDSLAVLLCCRLSYRKGIITVIRLALPPTAAMILFKSAK